MASAWNRLWFSESSLVRLGIFRILILIVAAHCVAKMHHISWHATMDDGLGMPHEWHPIYLFEILGLDARPTRAMFLTAHWAFVVAAVAGIAGIFTRAACAAVAVLFFYLAGVRFGFGQPHHDNVALMFGLAALPFAPVGARLSLESLLARRREDPVPTVAEGAALPIRFTQISVAIGYCAAGFSKMFMVGPEWLNGYTLQSIMLGTASPLSELAAADVGIVRIMSIGAVALQITFPICLFVPRLRWIYLPGVVGFHLSTWLTAGTGPYSALWGTALAAFIPFERRPRVTALLVAAWILIFTDIAWAAVLLVPLAVALLRRRVDVIYDGKCDLCRRTVATIRALDWGGRVRLLDLRDWDAVAAIHPHLDRDACEATMHAVAEGGPTAAGYEAYLLIAGRIPATLPLAPLLHLPALRAAGRRSYDRVARNRFCALHSS